MENDNNQKETDTKSVRDESEESDDENEDVFHFETEHLALRGNQCYGNLLRTIATLQAQRIRVHQQIDELEKARDLYLENPQLLLDRLRNKEPLIAPNYLTPIRLPELPTLTVKQEVKTETPAPNSQPTEEDKNNRNGSKTQTRLWTNEEQLRLEQLLIEYPPEEVEMRRFGKIAKALGNRTAQQVFSRVQKYFQKLHDAGMPVPGRLPKYRRAGGPARPKFNVRRSTFFPAQNIQIQMPEDEYTLDDLMPVAPSPPPTPAVKIEPKQEPDALESETQRKQLLQLKILTAIRDEKVQTEDGYSPDPLAPKCAECEESAVTQKRWHCNSCYCYLNLCGDCLAHQLITEQFEHLAHDVVEDHEP
ncbi:ZZ-type zinc finger-containing protein 3 [Drosophila novamexicana]|uniref:ZZ-type zinc finger-containing protein 3 n=1 Tax=Drosophila novamexicana TaxID=47314 RepID=UPI0011E5F90C|nr:ZZ-type zinc finger-containing protein 3 [Drosophila novamexicana]